MTLMPANSISRRPALPMIRRRSLFSKRSTLRASGDARPGCYVDIVCGSLDRLPRALAALDATERRTALATPPSDAEESDAPVVKVVTTSLPASDRRLIRTDGIHLAARSRAPRTLVRRSSGA